MQEIIKPTLAFFKEPSASCLVNVSPPYLFVVILAFIILTHPYSLVRYFTQLKTEFYQIGQLINGK